MRYKLSISVLSLGMLLLNAHTTYAKINRRTSSGDSQLAFGFKVGGSLNRISTQGGAYEKASIWQQPRYYTGNILFVTVGLTGEYPISPQFAVAAEVTYERKGSYDLNFPRMKVQLETINSPIFIKYYPKNMEEGISLQVGIQPSFILSRKYYRIVGDETEEQKEEMIERGELTEFENNYKAKTFDLAFVSGLEYTFSVGLKVGATMHMGLLERREDKVRDDKSTWTSVGNQLYIGYNLAKLLE